MKSMNPNASERDDRRVDYLGPNPRRWPVWLAQATVFSAVFVLLLMLYSMLGKIVEQFFIMLYVD